MFNLVTSESDDDLNDSSYHLNYTRLRDRTFKEHFRMHKHTFEVHILYAVDIHPTIVGSIVGARPWSD